MGPGKNKRSRRRQRTTSRHVRDVLESQYKMNQVDADALCRRFGGKLTNELRSGLSAARIASDLWRTNMREVNHA